jgi:hypothetical protein
MAEQDQNPVQAFSVKRWRERTVIAVTAVVVAGAGTASGLATAVIASPVLPIGPPPLASLPARPRVLRSERLAPAGRGRSRFRIGRWIRLRLARPAIRRAPESRSDTPALPTVGRPRDGPIEGPLEGQSQSPDFP